MIDASASIDKLIGSYRVEAELSHNDVSCVYRGEQTAPPERMVAIKLWHGIHLSPLKQLRFLQEARVLKMLKHPHLLPILESGLDEEGHPYLVSEYLPKGSLRERIGTEPGCPMPIQEAWIILSQVGQALQYAHHFRMLHGNLKPEHILFTDQGVTKLADFTINVLREAASGLPGDGMGAASYRAPEQFQGVTSEASDQYALGCIAYELLTGCIPFTAARSSASGVIRAQDSPQPPTRLSMLLPARMEEVILTALAKEQEARHATVKEFLAGLGQASLVRPRMLSVPTRPSPTHPAFSSAWPRTQLASGVPAVQPIEHHLQERGEVLGNGKAQQQDGLAEVPRLIEEEDTAALPSVHKALHLRSMDREEIPSQTAVPVDTQEGAGTLPHASATEARSPVAGRHCSSRRRSRLRWFTLVTVSLVITAMLISAISFALFKGPSPQTTTGIASAQPSPLPSVAASSTPSPSPTRQTSSAPSLLPSPSASPLPSPTLRPSPPPVPGLSVTPGQFKAQSDCVFRAHWYTCTAVLTLPQNDQSTLSWSASSRGLPQVSFSPSAGVLSPGQQQQVEITVRSNCPMTGSLIFLGGTRVTVPWTC